MDTTSTTVHQQSTNDVNSTSNATCTTSQHAYHTSNQTDLITFLLASCGSPIPSTWIKAIDKGHFAAWPGLTSNLMRKHLPKSMAMVKAISTSKARIFVPPNKH
jgi:hypothetical protein